MLGKGRTLLIVFNRRRWRKEREELEGGAGARGVNEGKKRGKRLQILLYDTRKRKKETLRSICSCAAGKKKRGGKNTLR